jgi:hypothetical protein
MRCEQDAVVSEQSAQGLTPTHCPGQPLGL